MPKEQQAHPNGRIDAKVFELRKLLMSGEDLFQVSEYFHNALVSDDAFMASGACASNPRLLDALEAVLGKAAPEGKLGTPLIVRLHELALCHGYTAWGRGHVLFFYFEQLDMGFCSYSPSLSSPQVTFMRFNLANATGGGAWSAWQSVREATCKAPH